MKARERAEARKSTRIKAKRVVAFMTSEFGWKLRCNDVEAAAREVLERLAVGRFVGHLVVPEELPKTKADGARAASCRCGA